MSKRLVTLRPDTRLVEAVRVLLRHKISGAPIVGEQGELLGIFSEFDCLRSLANEGFYEEQHEAHETVEEHMTVVTHTIPPELGLYRIAHAFVTLRVRRLPVIEEDKLIGQVSRRDVLRALDKLEERRHDCRRYPDYPAGREPIP